MTAADWFGDVERLRRLYAEILCNGRGTGGPRSGNQLRNGHRGAKHLGAGPGDEAMVLSDEYPSATARGADSVNVPDPSLWLPSVSAARRGPRQ